MNSTSAETPATISGVTSGISISTLLACAARERARTSANASVVPRTVPTTIVTSPISMLATSDSRKLTLLKNSSYHWRLKPEKFCSEGVELNENSATISQRREGEEHEQEEERAQEARAVEVAPPPAPRARVGGDPAESARAHPSVLTATASREARAAERRYSSMKSSRKAIITIVSAAPKGQFWASRNCPWIRLPTM